MRAGAAGPGVLDRPRGWPRGWASRGACGRRGAGGSAARGRGRAGAVSGLGPRAGQGCAEGEGASVVARQTRGSHAGAGGRREGGGAAWGWGGAAWGEGLGYLRECPHLRVWRAATTSPPLPAEQRHHRVASQRVLRLRGGGAWFPFASTVWTDGGRMCAPTDMAVGAQRQCTSGARWIGCWSRDNLRDSYTAQFEVGFDI